GGVLRAAALLRARAARRFGEGLTRPPPLRRTTRPTPLPTTHAESIQATLATRCRALRYRPGAADIAAPLARPGHRTAVATGSTGSAVRVAGIARRLQVLPGAVVPAVGLLAGHAHRRHALLRRGPWWQRPAHLHQLVLRRHLLGHQCRLDAVEQALEPADQLRLGDPQLGVGGGPIVGERQRDPVQLVDEVLAQPVLELVQGTLVDLGQTLPGSLVQRCRAHLVEQLFDHRADPHHLLRLLDHGRGFGILVVGGDTWPGSRRDVPLGPLAVLALRVHPGLSLTLRVGPGPSPALPGFGVRCLVLLVAGLALVLARSAHVSIMPR